MGKIKAVGNAVGNTVAAPLRVVGATGRSVLDMLRATGSDYPKDILDGLEGGFKNARDIFARAYTKNNKRYRNLKNISLSPFTATGAVVEGATRGVVEGGWNRGRRVKHALGNVLLTAGKAVQNVGSTKPMGDFYFEKRLATQITDRDKYLFRPSSSLGSEEASPNSIGTNVQLQHFIEKLNHQENLLNQYQSAVTRLEANQQALEQKLQQFMDRISSLFPQPTPV